MAHVNVAEAAAQLRADLQLLDASAKGAAQLLDLAAWQLGELDRQARPMTATTAALARARDNIQAARRSSEEVLEHLDASRRMQPVIQAGPRGASLEAFLAALDRLEAAIDFLQAHRSLQSAEDALRHTTALRDSGLVAAGGEFGAVLQKAAAPVPQALLARARAAAGGDGGALPPDAPLELLPGWALARLRQLAEAMLRGGGTPASRACMRQYAEARRGVLLAALEGFLAPFAGGGSSREEAARATWQQMEGRIPGWVAALQLFVRLAQEEARLCAAVFPAAERATVLAQVAASGAAPLLNAAEAVVAARRVPEKMFGLLDMHAGVEAALAPLRAALAAGPGSRERASLGAEQAAVVAQLQQLRGRLAGEVRACFGELQDSLLRDAARGVPADGTVHPLVASTVALLRRTLAYPAALPVLFADAASPAGRPGGGLAEEARLLELMGRAVCRMFDTLLSALEAKARASYKPRGLAALHGMNNVAFVAHTLGASREFRAAGEAWLEKNQGKVGELQQQYVEAAWGGLLALLRQDAAQPLPPGLAGDKAARQAVKDKWAAVNKALAEAQAQQAWAVPDAALRHAIRDALAEALVPLFEAFCAKYRGAPYTDNHRKYEQHSPADLAALLGDLFERAEGGGSAALIGRSPPSAGLLTRRLSGSSARRGTGSQGTP